MAKATPSSNENESLDVMGKCVRKDDDLLTEIQEGSVKLSPVSEDVLELEYRECCENARHAKQLRAMLMGLWAAFCGILFLAVALSLATSDALPNEAWILVMLISVTGVAVTYFIHDVEFREQGYYREWCKRCRVLEARMGFAGQYWRTYRNLIVPAENIFQLRTMIRIYHFGIGLWIAVFILSLLALILP